MINFLIPCMFYVITGSFFIYASELDLGASYDSSWKKLPLDSEWDVPNLLWVTPDTHSEKRNFNDINDINDSFRNRVYVIFQTGGATNKNGCHTVAYDLCARAAHCGKIGSKTYKDDIVAAWRNVVNRYQFLYENINSIARKEFVSPFQARNWLLEIQEGLYFYEKQVCPNSGLAEGWALPYKIDSFETPRPPFGKKLLITGYSEDKIQDLDI